MRVPKRQFVFQFEKQKKRKAIFVCYSLSKGTLSGLRQFLATENPSKMIKTAFYFA